MFLRSRFFRFENDSLATAQQLLSHCLAGSDNRFTIASRRTESGSFTRQNLSQLSAARNKPQYLEWGCSSAGEHFPRTEGVGRSNRLSSTIFLNTGVSYFNCKNDGPFSLNRGKGFFVIPRNMHLYSCCTLFPKSIFCYNQSNIFTSCLLNVLKCCFGRSTVLIP